MSRIGLLASTLATAEPMLVAVVGLLILVIAGLVAMAFLVRRRSKVVEDTTDQMRAIRTPAPPPPSAPPPRPRPRPQMVRGGGGGGGLARRDVVGATCARRAAPSFTA